MLPLLRRSASAAAAVAGSSSSSTKAIVRCFTAAVGGGRGGGGKGGGKDDGKDDGGAAAAAAAASAAATKEKDPFGFRELKAKYKGAEGGGADFPDLREEDVATMEAEMDKTGRVTAPRNVFGIDYISKEMTQAWEEGMLPPQLYPPESAQAPGLESPEDLYWPGNLETTLPRDSDRLYPSGGDRAFSPEEMQEMYEADIGGVCEGKKQRRGSQPLRCKKVDLNEVAFPNVAVLAQFLSPVGLIKPRRMSGLCAKCQRKVARTVKQARHLGVLPHTSGVDLYQRLKVEGEEEFDPAAGVASAPLLSRRGGGGGGREGGRGEELLKKIPSLTI